MAFDQYHPAILPELLCTVDIAPDGDTVIVSLFHADTGAWSQTFEGSLASILRDAISGGDARPKAMPPTK